MQVCNQKSKKKTSSQRGNGIYPTGGASTYARRQRGDTYVVAWLNASERGGGGGFLLALLSEFDGLGEKVKGRRG